MKKILFIALLVIPFIGFSQTTKPIDGFLGIKFGSSKAIVMAAVKAKGGTYNKSASEHNKLAFDNVKLGHRPALGLIVFFVDDKACEADYIFETDVEAKVPGFYSDLVNDFNSVYGPGEGTRNFTDPYQDGDGNELLGLSAGKIDYHTLWFDSKKNSIKANINEQMQIILTYQDAILSDLYDAREKAKESKDL